ncbi:MAG TPA: hypothetical protein VLJ39_08605 [Tepidisphaeraceae bacterium]|nr:hypothetical protein [Tepidisphaeraceae bacterium]
MQIVLAILAAYVLGGSIWPQLVRQREMFLAGTAMTILAMLLQSFGWHPIFFLGDLAQIGAFVLLVLAAGGGGLAQYWRDIRGLIGR